MESNRWLLLGGFVSIAIALLHVAVIFMGAEGYRYFGAGEEMAVMDEQGSSMPALITSVVIAFFTLFGVYAFSAAGTIRRLPFLKAAIVTITVIYLLRGAGGFVELFGILTNDGTPVRFVIFSLVSLLTGLVYLAGIRKSWKQL